MSTYVLSYLYIQALLFVGAFIWCCERILRKKNIVNLRGKVLKQKEKKMNYVIKIILFIFLAWCNWYLTYPAIKDLPYVINKNYRVIEGYTNSSDKTRNNISRMRVFIVESENQKVKIHASTTYVTKGIWMKVNYLPNTHYGTVIVREGENNE